jgi:hypothetical protein
LDGLLRVVFFIGSVIVWLGFVVWPVRKVAQWVEAGKTGFGTCVLALLLAHAVGGVVAAIMGALALTPLLSIPIALIASLFIFASVLSTTMGRGFVIAVAGTVLSVIMIFSAVAIFAVVVGGAATLGADKMADNMECVETVSNSGKRSVSCRSGSSTSSSMSSTTSISSSSSTIVVEPDEEPEPAQKPKPVVRKKAVPTFHDARIEELVASIGMRVQITGKDGRVHTGTLVSVGKASIKVRKRVSGGTLVFPISKTDIKSAKVRE